MSYVAFFVIAAVAIGSALGLLLKKNAIHGALFLVVNLGSVAALYLMLGAEFLAAAQVIVYAGAIMVLFVFAIMVLIPGKEETGADPRRVYRLIGVPVGFALFVELVVILARNLPAGPSPVGGVPATVAGAGPIGAADGWMAPLKILFTQYLFPFELTSVLLLAAMVGVLVLTRRGAG